MFLDEAVVELSSGRGGAGAITFHREKHVPRGGPTGATGGKGGDIVLIADASKRTLYDFKLRPIHKAVFGGDAQGNKAGKNATDVELRVPVGTVAIDVETEQTIADLSVEGARVVVCKGGRGGKGNAYYVSSVRQAPKIAEKGEPGESISLRLELKLLADIGLIGLPNAGKSTLLASISAAKPKIADYPFTTVAPNLGVVRVGDETFTVADLPGLIEGAAGGKGLGHRFLRHAERSAALVHVVDVAPIDESDPLGNFKLVEDELSEYSPDLAAKPRMIALNKIDLIDAVQLKKITKAFAKQDAPALPISAVTKKGVDALLFAMAEVVRNAPRAREQTELVLRPVKDDSWSVQSVNGGFIVTGKRVERMVAMTDLENHDAVRHLHKRLERMGLIKELRNLGAQEGDTVAVGDVELDFTDEA